MHHLLKDDMRIAGRWHLRHPTDEHGEKINPWQFTKGQRFESHGAIRFLVKPDGLALELTQDAFLTPVVHGRVVHLFERMGIQEVQFIPIQVEGHAIVSEELKQALEAERITGTQFIEV